MINFAEKYRILLHRIFQLRRIALYRFAPANMAYGRGYLEAPGYAGLTEAERAVLAPPYATRLERALVTPEGAVRQEQRAAAKKAFDRKLFGTPYFKGVK